MADVQTQADYPRGLTFEHVWAAIMKTQEQVDKIAPELEKFTKENNKRFGDINNHFGDLVECIISPNILDKFKDLGLDFETATSNFKVRDHKNKIYFEIDVFLQNTTIAMLVEIKTELKIKYVNEHIERIEKMRTYADLHDDKKRIFLGAVAGIVVSSDVKTYALENGLYLIEPSGEDLNITPPYKNHKEW